MNHFFCMQKHSLECRRCPASFCVFGGSVILFSWLYLYHDRCACMRTVMKHAILACLLTQRHLHVFYGGVLEPCAQWGDRVVEQQGSLCLPDLEDGDLADGDLADGG